MRWLNLWPSKSGFVSLTAKWQTGCCFLKTVIRIFKDNKITLAINLILIPIASSIFLGRILVYT